MESYLQTFQSYAPKKSLFSNIAGATAGEENIISQAASNNYNSLLSAYKNANAIRQSTDEERKAGIRNLVAETTLGVAVPAALGRASSGVKGLYSSYKSNLLEPATEPTTEATTDEPELPNDEPTYGTGADDTYEAPEYDTYTPFEETTSVAPAEVEEGAAIPELAEEGTASALAETGAATGAAEGAADIAPEIGEAAAVAPEVVIPLAIAAGLAVGVSEIIGNNPISDAIGGLFGGGGGEKKKPPPPPPPPALITRQIPTLSGGGRLPEISGAVQY